MSASFFIFVDLKSLKSHLDRLEKAERDFGGLADWKRHCGSILKDLYPDSDLVRELESIDVDFPVTWANGEPEQFADPDEYYGDALARLERVLAKFSSTVREYGAPASHKTWLRRLILSSVGSLLVGAVLALLGVYATGHLNTASIRRDWQLTAVSMANWQQGFDKTLLDGYQALREDAARRGVYESGPMLTETIRYFTEKRRVRDNTLDSFLVAYSIQGGDTLTLKYKRKLPVNVLKILHDLNSQFDAEYRNQRLDTL